MKKLIGVGVVAAMLDVVSLGMVSLGMASLGMASAGAQTICQRIGNATFCDNGLSSQKIGNTSFYNGTGGAIPPAGTPGPYRCGGVPRRPGEPVVQCNWLADLAF